MIFLPCLRFWSLVRLWSSKTRQRRDLGTVSSAPLAWCEVRSTPFGVRIFGPGVLPAIFHKMLVAHHIQPAYRLCGSGGSGWAVNLQDHLWETDCDCFFLIHVVSPENVTGCVNSEGFKLEHFCILIEYLNTTQSTKKSNLRFQSGLNFDRLAFY